MSHVDGGGAVVGSGRVTGAHRRLRPPPRLSPAPASATGGLSPLTFGAGPVGHLPTLGTLCCFECLLYLLTSRSSAHG